VTSRLPGSPPACQLTRPKDSAPEGVRPRCYPKPPCAMPRPMPTKAPTTPVTMKMRCSLVADTSWTYRPTAKVAIPRMVGADDQPEGEGGYSCAEHDGSRNVEQRVPLTVTVQRQPRQLSAVRPGGDYLAHRHTPNDVMKLAVQGSLVPVCSPVAKNGTCNGGSAVGHRLQAAGRQSAAGAARARLAGRRIGHHLAVGAGW
jgi:hypothetical protein